jgi:Flp pilus assembly protein TadB
VSRRAQLRASDADRERIADRLREAAAEGRLLTHELEQRLAVAFSARTYGELDALVFDLPTGRLERRQRSSVTPWVKPALALAIAIPMAVAMIAVALFVLTGVIATWMLWVGVMWWFFGHRHRGRGRFPSQQRMGPPPRPRSWI